MILICILCPAACRSSDVSQWRYGYTLVCPWRRLTHTAACLPMLLIVNSHTEVHSESSTQHQRI